MQDCSAHSYFDFSHDIYSFNLFEYMDLGDNPLKYIDPTGLSSHINESNGYVFDTDYTFNFATNSYDYGIYSYPFVGGEMAYGPANYIEDSYRIETFNIGNA